MIQFYCGLSDGENTICINGKIRWDYMPCGPASFRTNPFNFSYIAIPISQSFAIFGSFRLFASIFALSGSRDCRMPRFF